MDHRKKALSIIVAGILIFGGALLIGCNEPTATPTSVVVVVTATPEATATTAVIEATDTPVSIPTSVPASVTPVPEASATLTPTQSRDDLAKITADVLNVRQGPGTGHAILTTVEGGSTVTVLGTNEAGAWLQVRVPDGTVGWVSRAYTDFSGTVSVVPAPPLPATATPTDTASDGQWHAEYYGNRTLWGTANLERYDSEIDFDWGLGSPASQLPADGFSTRWARKMWFAEGRYRFHALVDDGVRLYVDGAMILDSWVDGGQREETAELDLSAGEHHLRVEYYENTGQAVIRVWWEWIMAPSPTPTSEPATYPDWKARYWDNPGLDGTRRIIRNDEQLDFDWGRGAPDPRLPSDDFSARWTQSEKFDAGTYRFHVLVDDGARVWVDGRLIIDEWRPGGLQEVYEDVELKKGKHEIEVHYFEHRGDARIRLWWERYPPVKYSDWKGEYWGNRDLVGTPLLLRNDESINFNWKEASPAYRLPADRFSARWTRELTFQPGIYRFYPSADDGIRFYLDGTLVLDEWHVFTRDTGHTVDLQLGGAHTLVVEYFELTGNARVQFRWEKIRDLAAPTNTPTSTPTSTPTTAPAATPTATLSATPTATPVPVTVTPQEGVEGDVGTTDTLASESALRANHRDLMAQKSLMLPRTSLRGGVFP